MMLLMIKTWRMTSNISYELALLEDKAKLIDFMILNLKDETYRGLAENYVSCSFSNDFRKPTFFVAKIDERVIGSVAYSEELFTIDTWGVSWLNVHEDFRRRGIGGRLLNTAVKAIEEKSGTIILSTFPHKTKLYENHGFLKSGEDHEGGNIMIRFVNLVSRKA